MIALIFALIGVLPAYFVAGWYSAVNHIKWFKIGEKKAYGRVYQSQLNTILICNLLIWSGLKGVSANGFLISPPR